MMNKMMKSIVFAAVVCSGVFFTACNEFLGILPKGEKIPATLNDFDALIRHEDYHLNDMTQAINLLNDIYRKPETLNGVSLTSINYNWLEEQDRIYHNNSDEDAYYRTYQAIFAWNLILQNAADMTECTERERAALVAQAKVLRAMNYFNILNYYADAYKGSTAAKKLSVPLITSPDMGAPSEQVTIARMYEFILGDLKEAVPDLPEESATILHPNKGTGYAMLARVYLAMENYEDALTNANLALEQNDALFDWTQYYEENRVQIELPDDWTTSYPPVGLANPENYIFRYGTFKQKFYGQSGTNGALSAERAELFERGDARLASKWKKRYMSPDTIYYGIRNDRFNGGGITTPEMYYIKAECIARQGGQENLDQAMGVLNTVRKTRIFAEEYHDLYATSVVEAVRLIVQEKANEYVQTPIPFWDARRLNLHPEYAVTRTKEVDGKILTLAPDSHLWTMPFPLGAIKKPGNGTLIQNVER